MGKKLTETQLLLLNNLIYRKEFTAESSEGKDVETILKEIIANENGNSPSQEMTSEEWDAIYAMALDDPDVLKLKVHAIYDEKSTGARMACFVDENNQAYAVFAGTGQNEWRDDCIAGNIADSPQQIKAKEWIDSLNYNNIIASGHSKGGNKAMYVAVTSDKVSECYAFDGEGFSNEFIKKYEDKINNKKKNIHLRANYKDYVNCLLINIAGDTKYIVNDVGVSNPKEYHCPNALFKYDKYGNIVYSIGDGSSESQYPLMEMFNEFTVYLINNATETEKMIALSVIGELLTQFLGDENGVSQSNIIGRYGVEAGEIIVRYLTQYLQELLCSNPIKFAKYQAALDKFVDDSVDGGFLEFLGASLGISMSTILTTGGLYLVVTGTVEKIYRTAEFFAGGNIKGRDFSQSAKDTLLKVAKETEEEPWWRVDRWDCWYRVENFFGHLNLDNYTADADAYYRKLVDINDASVDDINKIFNKVKFVDDTYSEKMRTQYNNMASQILKSLKNINNCFNV